MRRNNLLVRLLLIIAVIISLVLSFLIWTNNQRYERKTDTETTAKREETNTEQDNLEQVYLPTEIVTVSAKKQHQLIYDHQISLATEMRSVMKQWQFRAPRISRTKYTTLINQPSSLQLSYHDFISVKLFGRVISQKALKNVTRDRQFNRIVLKTQSKVATVYFLNDKTKQVWQSRVTDIKITRVLKLLKAADFHAPIHQQNINGKLRVFYDQTISLKPYSYLINRRNENTYISSLLSDSSNSAVDTRESGSKTIYYGGNYRDRQLTVDHRSDQLKFVDNTATTIPSSRKSLLEKSFAAINNVDNPLTDVRYYSADEEKHAVSYRSYVEGFPIFQQSDFGAFEYGVTDTGTTINFSSRILQVPVPAQSKQVDLPATTELIKELENAGYSTSKIQDLVIGYRWIPATNENDIVDLKPTYYVKIDDRWRDYQDWLTDQAE